jgi:hypothetical protein
MKRYRKKQVEVEAVFWAVGAAFPRDFLRDDEVAEHQPDGAVLVKRDGIPRLVVDHGRFLVRRSSDGRLFAWKPDIFEATYEEVGEGERCEACGKPATKGPYPPDGVSFCDECDEALAKDAREEVPDGE